MRNVITVRYRTTAGRLLNATAPGFQESRRQPGTAMALVMFCVGLWAIRGRFLTTPDVNQSGPVLVLPSKALLPLGVIAFCGFLAEGARD